MRPSSNWRPTLVHDGKHVVPSRASQLAAESLKDVEPLDAEQLAQLIRDVIVELRA